MTTSVARSDPAATGLARAAGASGVAFALLFAVSLVLVHQAPGLDDPDAAYVAFYSSGAQSLLVTIGLYLVPFAGIACLWHVVATRTLLQTVTPRATASMPLWLQLTSGVLFVALMFVGTATVGGMALLSRFSDAPAPSADVARALSAVGYTIVFVYGVRAAGMYMITTTGLARRAGVMNRPVAALGLVAATFLLVSTTFHPAILLVFPAWLLLVSVLLLRHRPATAHDTGDPP
jgi:hypothetical protein